MRFIFKTDYDQDIRLIKHRGAAFWYAVLGILLLAAPALLSEYFLSQLVFILIYSIVGLGLMLLAGFTGQVSIGHAAFLAVGAYTEAYLQSKGWPFAASLAAAAILSAATGVLVGLPALRTKGMYLAIATLAFGFIIEEVVVRAEGITGGNSGKQVGRIEVAGVLIDSEARFYYLTLILTVGVTLLVLNLMRSPTGRAFVAVRDSEISAQSMGIHLARYKTIAFALSAAIAGIGGAIYAHKLRFLSPEQFTFLQSIELLMMVVIGGLGFVHGAFFGAAFWVVTQQLIVLAKDYLPESIAQQSGLQPTVFGVILIAFVLFEPMGLYGRWLKVRTYLELFPFYRRGMFKRQKSYMKSERLK
ncbi:branched-chain amino acid ABC transporter permease [Noviherbaspirillum sp.]|uniref:branched-chain amino acid ABC transporter permease n=1 Tax=Noviherbaspirillum sp. TaxID=1926288 RepID=UPI002D3EC6C6|nr:branched-chain amino acid ABC transporter permease [Noviherbaspirillum sp.]HZW19713.1 branched-chain amino acid ABC transporter permease [Noviherbaspirillum sp.]